MTKKLWTPPRGIALPRRREVLTGAAALSLMPAVGRACPPTVETPNATSVTNAGILINASPNPGTAGTGNMITFTGGGAITVNGATKGGAGVTGLYYIGHTAYWTAGSNLWNGPITTAGVGTNVLNPTLPPALVAKGLTNWAVVFQDDFTSSLLQPNPAAGYNSSFNWFASQNAANPVSSTNYNMLTSTHASAIGNGASGGGSFPSPNGGIFQIFGQPSMTYNGNWATVTDTTTPATGRKFKYFYARAYLQYQHSVLASGGIGGGWPAFWSYSDANPATGKPCEEDFIEDQGVSPFWTIWDPGGGDPQSNTVSAGDSISPNEPNGDSNWHDYGFLWRQTGTNQGEITLWYDNVQIPNANAKRGVLSSTFTTGTGGQLPDLDFTAGLWITLGCGQPSYTPPATNRAMNVDYVQVFQAI